jgi:hypothetical protein
VVLGFCAVDLSHATIHQGTLIGTGLFAVALCAFGSLEIIYIRNKRRRVG